MANRRFRLIATVSTENPAVVLPVLKDVLGKDFRIEEMLSKDIKYGKKGEFRIEAELSGENAKDLNRSLLSALRKAERRTSIRAAWTSARTVEQYFDYLLNKTAEEP